MTTRSKKPASRPVAKSKPTPKPAKSAAPRKTAPKPTPKPAAKAAPRTTAGASGGVVYASALREMIAKRLGRV